MHHYNNIFIDFPILTIFKTIYSNEKYIQWIYIKIKRDQ